MMNSSKLIDISKSSLVGLKAELLKKQEEVKRLKEQNLEARPNFISSKSNKKSPEKCNTNIEERILSDKNNTEEEFDAIKKSREILEAKARLYEKLKSGSNNIDSKKAQYLIDFDLKQEIENCPKSIEEPSTSINCIAEKEEEDNDNYSDDNSDPENDWVDFTDTLGRSKRCLRKDLSAMKAKDAKLAADLKPTSPPPATVAAPELLSWDMQREIMRQKWEQQETLLLGKTNIHYQDVLFDENRTHGVGYFEFSTDEEERLRQQEALKKLRKETEEQQQAAVGLRARRQQQLQTRLAAARRRKRERLGLPPDSTEPPQIDLLVENIEEKQEEKVKDIEEIISRIAPVRPWDIGKQDSNPVMTQDEWIEKKRQERPAEFAPPSTVSVEAVGELSQSVTSKSNFFTTKKTSSSKNRKLFKEQVLVNHSFTDKRTSEVQNYTNESETTGSSMFSGHIPPYQDDENRSFTKHIGDKDTKLCEWKPTLADIENLLETTKKQTSETSSSRDLTSEIQVPIRKPTAERYHQRKNSSVGPFSQQLLSVDKSHKIEEIINEVDEDKVSTSTANKSDLNRKRYIKKWAAIPPPAAMSYYTEENARTQPNRKRSGDIADSLSVGINLLKERSEEKQSKRLKGLLDIV